MQKIKKEIEVDRYEIKGRGSEHSFVEIMGYYDYDELKIVYNEAGTRSDKVYENSLGDHVEKHSFKKIEDIEKYSEKLGLKEWTVVSFYQENGYMGVYTNDTKDALRVKCNNWVRGGADGFKFVIFASSKVELDEAISALKTYCGTGIAEYSIYDRLTEDYVEDFYDLGGYEDIKHCLEPYGFDENWFNHVNWE